MENLIKYSLALLFIPLILSGDCIFGMSAKEQKAINDAIQASIQEQKSATDRKIEQDNIYRAIRESTDAARVDEEIRKAIERSKQEEKEKKAKLRLEEERIMEDAVLASISELSLQEAKLKEEEKKKAEDKAREEQKRSQENIRALYNPVLDKTETLNLDEQDIFTGSTFKEILDSCKADTKKTSLVQAQRADNKYVYYDFIEFMKWTNACVQRAVKITDPATTQKLIKTCVFIYEPEIDFFEYSEKFTIDANKLCKSANDIAGTFEIFRAANNLPAYVLPRHYNNNDN